MFRFQGTKKAVAVHSSRFFSSTEPLPRSKGREAINFVKEYAAVFTLMGSTLLAATYATSYVQDLRSELKRIKEVHAAEIARVEEVHAAEIARVKEIHAADIARVNDGFERVKEVHASEIARVNDGFDRVKEVHASEIERVKAQAAKQAVEDYMKYSHSPVPPATPAAVLPLVLAVEATWSHTTASSDDNTAPAQKMAASRSVDASFGQSATMLSLPEVRKSDGLSKETK
eukprot:gene12952-9261_t